MSLADMIREAERRAERRSKGLPLHETPAEIEARAAEEDARLEREIQAEVVRIYRANGCVVYSTSSTRRSRIAAGIPDLIVFHAGAGVHLYHETKTPRGKLRPDQVDFAEQCIRTNTVHIVGGVQAAELAVETLIRGARSQS